jgi:transcriptional regulator with PAS, ATPase and Fis domain
MQLEQIYDAICAIAEISEGYATITDLHGIRLRTYNSQREEIVALRGQVYNLAKLAGETGEVQVGYSQIVEGARAWAIPWDQYVIAAGNLNKMQRDQELKASLINALPFIARVVGGEAVIFDQDGMRIKSVDAAGKNNINYIGTVSTSAREAMHRQAPTFGESTSTHGAIAVRVPITRSFGLGFNNELTVRNEKKLFEEVKKYQTARYNLHDIIGESEKITRVKNLCRTASKASTILLYGETGTGKELFAQAIHNLSDRRSKPFLAINCGAIPASIIESYLFGYSGGAFTGAKKEGSIGAFEQANHGTIFLDEISEMPMDLQIRLLRVIQEKEIMRVGDFKPVKLDVRIISSSNQDLLKAVNEGRFREDLYYRINVIEINIPPLRERKEDIPLLVKHFIHEFNGILGKFVLQVEPDAYEVLMRNDWRGNVRELKSAIERAMNVIDVNNGQLKVNHLPPYLIELGINKGSTKPNYAATLKNQVQSIEIAAIKSALKITNNHKKEAAALLGISTITLWRKLKDYQLVQ